ncbi:hypothetical protein [Ferruginibacter sp. SUN106]|uniref:hypothetical protein n=1 Tax=Ferruginibacter sp. SUN106 TaxID=2978348 RepID=UPI003D36BCEC
MKTIALITLSLAAHFCALCQFPAVIPNYTAVDAADLQPIDSFIKKQTCVLAYKEEGGFCHDCPTYSYKIISYNNRQWSSCTFSNYSIRGTFNKKTKVVVTDTVRTGTWYKAKFKLHHREVQQLFDSLTAIHFWSLHNDSLNQIRKIIRRIYNGDTAYINAGVIDDMNYRFDIVFKNKRRMIRSYAPEYFVSLFPDMTDRKIFLQAREIFLRWWDKYGK